MSSLADELHPEDRAEDALARFYDLETSTDVDTQTSSTFGNRMASYLHMSRFSTKIFSALVKGRFQKLLASEQERLRIRSETAAVCSQIMVEHLPKVSPAAQRLLQCAVSIPT